MIPINIILGKFYMFIKTFSCDANFQLYIEEVVSFNINDYWFGLRQDSDASGPTDGWENWLDGSTPGPNTDGIRYDIFYLYLY